MHHISSCGVCVLVFMCLCVWPSNIKLVCVRDLMLPHAEGKTVDQQAPRLQSTWRFRWSSHYPISPVINHCPVTQQEASLYVPKACRAIKSPSYFPILCTAACERPHTVSGKAYVRLLNRHKDIHILQTQMKTCIFQRFSDQEQTG